MDLSRRVIVALDHDNAQDAAAMVDRLGDAGQAYKIGLELLTAAGPSLAAALAAIVDDLRAAAREHSRVTRSVSS
ncbi:orotidine 5'-phosphate decarboxylase / HUMPS family protein [Dactylosporangium sp. CA-152071]|uniref:orotidine 5'-phosphate decarboxylase / HUMPS family protein n=1 Tax=Dactylosporangium sp. CA-152071 TaxID=3239933 RepID=UPI003D8C4A8E